MWLSYTYIGSLSFNETKQYDLGINFSGYPLEDMDHLIAEEIQNMLLENNCRRFPKNRNYKLKLVIEEI